jgi:hypothetical protein
VSFTGSIDDSTQQSTSTNLHALLTPQGSEFTGSIDDSTQQSTSTNLHALLTPQGGEFTGSTQDSTQEAQVFMPCSLHKQYF